MRGLNWLASTSHASATNTIASTATATPIPIRIFFLMMSWEALRNHCAAQLAASAPLLYAGTGPVLGAHLPNELRLFATFFIASVDSSARPVWALRKNCVRQHIGVITAARAGAVGALQWAFVVGPQNCNRVAVETGDSQPRFGLTRSVVAGPHRHRARRVECENLIRRCYATGVRPSALGVSQGSRIGSASGIRS